ncbi:helix-turn-helix domain-containing protein [Eubacteriales bacterium OttesenSCG-928-A19]|nr:helix-turn-helix domain-containing protein [Eubacteriales bacterium OttesenSCG-928-A19]
MDATRLRMKLLREKADMKQSTLSDELGISQSMISNYENGREPPFDVLLAYMKYFDVSADYLLGVTDTKKPVSSDSLQFISATAQIAERKGAKKVASISEIMSLYEKIRAYYKAGAPAGNTPIETLAGILEGLNAALDASTENDIGALLLAVNETVTSALQINNMLISPESAKEAPES